MSSTKAPTLKTASRALTRGIRVEVESEHRPEHSEPAASQWFFAYHIRIANEGRETVRLVSRHWLIKDALGQVEEVEGLGVIGEQPVLGPGESFEYTSGCPLTTPFGSMEGSYRMVTEGGDEFEAAIARFGLVEPGALH